MSIDKFTNLYCLLDSTARSQLCDRLGFPRTSKRNETQERITDVLGASWERLLELLDRDDLIAAFRTWFYMWDEKRAHLLGLRDAPIDVLRVAAKRLVVDDWDPSEPGEVNAADTGGNRRLRRAHEMNDAQAAHNVARCTWALVVAVALGCSLRTQSASGGRDGGAIPVQQDAASVLERVPDPSRT